MGLSSSTVTGAKKKLSHEDLGEMFPHGEGGRKEGGRKEEEEEEEGEVRREEVRVRKERRIRT